MPKTVHETVIGQKFKTFRCSTEQSKTWWSWWECISLLRTSVRTNEDELVHWTIGHWCKCAISSTFFANTEAATNSRLYSLRIYLLESIDHIPLFLLLAAVLAPNRLLMRHMKWDVASHAAHRTTVRLALRTRPKQRLTIGINKCICSDVYHKFTVNSLRL